MLTWNEKFFQNFVLENNIIGFFEEPIKLKSGRMSCWYVNWRNAAEDVFLLNELANYVIAFVHHLGLKLDCFYGVPEGATKLGVIVQYIWAMDQPNYKKGMYVASMGRGNPKEHGDPKDRFFLGVPKGNIVVLEDVTTTGGSLISTLDKLSQIEEANVIAAIGLTNRNENRNDGKSVKDALLDIQVPYYAMSNALDLLPIAYGQQNPGEEIKKQLEKYFEEYGTQELELEL